MFLIGIFHLDWSQTELGRSPIELEMSAMVLPLVLRNFTPRPVTIVGMSTMVIYIRLHSVREALACYVLYI